MCNPLSHCNKHAETVIIVCRFVVGEILYPQLFFFLDPFFLDLKHPFPVWMLHPGYMPQIKSARFREDEMRSKSCRLGSFCSNLRIPGVCGKNRMCFFVSFIVQVACS